MKTKILRNTFLGVGVLIASAGILAAGTSDGVLQGNVSHGFARALDGTFTIFGAPGAGTERDVPGIGQGTFVFGVDNLNPAGAISGVSIDENNVWHGFVRVPDGTVHRLFLPKTILLLADVTSRRQTAAYVCENFTCNAPVTDPEKLAKFLKL